MKNKNRKKYKIKASQKRKKYNCALLIGNNGKTINYVPFDNVCVTPIGTFAVFRSSSNPAN